MEVGIFMAPLPGAPVGPVPGIVGMLPIGPELATVGMLPIGPEPATVGIFQVPEGNGPGAAGPLVAGGACMGG